MQNVLFDPGYSSCVLGISDNASFMYSAFVQSAMPLKQKKFQFSLIFSKIKNLIEKNTAFYLGCLLWAVYIKSFTNAQIENNPSLYGEFDENSALEELNYLLDIVNFKLNKDAKYFINQSYSPKKELEIILKTYIEFLKLNKGFVNTKNTDEIILPECIKRPNKKQLSVIKNKIDETLTKKDLQLLYDVYELIL